jgi:hypothetical protein
MTGLPTGRRWRRTPQPVSLPTRDTEIMTQPDPYPNPAPGLIEPTPADRPAPLSDERARRERRWSRARRIRVTCTIITTVCGLFAAVLVAQIIMVAGGANPANGVATFVRGWADGVSLGFENLFTPANATARVLFNDGLAALVWLGLGAVLTALIRRLARRGPDQVG